MCQWNLCFRSPLFTRWALATCSLPSSRSSWPWKASPKRLATPSKSGHRTCPTRSCGATTLTITSSTTTRRWGSTSSTRGFSTRLPQTTRPGSQPGSWTAGAGPTPTGTQAQGWASPATVGLTMTHLTRGSVSTMGLVEALAMVSGESALLLIQCGSKPLRQLYQLYIMSKRIQHPKLRHEYGGLHRQPEISQQDCHKWLAMELSQAAGLQAQV